MVLKKIIRKPLTGGYKNLKTELFEEKINEDITERELRQNQEVLVNKISWCFFFLHTLFLIDVTITT